jgi:hypothetical protein
VEPFSLFLRHATTEAKRQYPTVALIDGGLHAVFIALNVLAEVLQGRAEATAGFRS